MNAKATNLIGLIDARTAGVSGDKFLGALVGLGASPARLSKVGKTVSDCLPGTHKVDVRVQKVERGEIGATLVSVKSNEELGNRSGTDLKNATVKCCVKLHLSGWGTNLALSSIQTLLNAESRVHNRSPIEVELHELGLADTLVDIVGVAYLAEELGLDRATWWSTAISVGTGISHFSGRDYPNPPPAVAEILRSNKFPMQSGRSPHELSTPTGVAITVNLASKVLDEYPTILVEKIGYGAGSHDLAEVANVLRLVMGRREDAMHTHDEVVVLQTNLDDVSGEVIGHAVEELMAEGARDVSVTPIFMKKNRPGHMITVIADRADDEKLANLLIDLTGTFGVRETPVTRHISRRVGSTVKIIVNGKSYSVRVKTAQNQRGRPIRSKMEYEDLKRISNRTGRSLRELTTLTEESTRRVSRGERPPET